MKVIFKAGRSYSSMGSYREYPLLPTLIFARGYAKGYLNFYHLEVGFLCLKASITVNLHKSTFRA